MINKLAACAIIAASAATTNAEVLLLIDLSVHERLTITATTGRSANTISGNNLIGIYLQGIIGSEFSGSGNSDFVINSTLTTPTASLGTAPLLYAPGPADYGLNIFALSADPTIHFTQGQQAFTGTATWDTPDLYEDIQNGATSGNIYFPAANNQSINNAALLGTYQVIPAPAPLATLSILTLAATRRMRT